MLSEAAQWELLEKYAGGSSEPALLLWWGRYCESRGNMEGAVDCYRRAGAWAAAGWLRRCWPGGGGINGTCCASRQCYIELGPEQQAGAAVGEACTRAEPVKRPQD